MADSGGLFTIRQWVYYKTLRTTFIQHSTLYTYLYMVFPCEKQDNEEFDDNKLNDKKDKKNEQILTRNIILKKDIPIFSKKTQQ